MMRPPENMTEIGTFDPPRAPLRRSLRIGVFALVLLISTIGVASGCRKERSPDHLNVVIIMIDTLRADHLGTYGAVRPTSPNIDDLALEGVTFDRNWAQAPCTFPSVNSLLTSRYPVHLLKGQRSGDLGIPEGIPTLAEMLKARGYSTHAVSASPIVRATPSSNNNRGEFGRGFDTFNEECLWSTVECVNAFATSILDRISYREKVFEASIPFFLYLHYLDPHDPYRTPSHFNAPFSGRYAGSVDWVENGDPNPLAEMIYDDGEKVEFESTDLAYLEARYDDEIAFVDLGIRALLDRLEEQELIDKTMVVVVSDHGESFMEHGQIKHCYHLYEDNLHTPLIIKVPGMRGSRRVEAATSNLDLVPTILDYVDELLPDEVVGAAAPLSEGFQGRTLRALIEDPAESSGVVEKNLSFAGIGSYRAVTDGRFKLIRNLRSGENRLFDLDADRDEVRDVAQDHRKEFRQLLIALDGWLLKEEGSEGKLAETEETVRQLRALGYLQ